MVPDKGFGDRLSTATSARKAMQQRFQAKAGADDSAFAERKAARHAISVAREVRLAERETAKAAEAVREAEERAHDAAEQEAREITERGLQLEREAREAVETAERQVALEVEQKAARDARYAARKARK
ncbi:hypothetical protein J4G37_29105 [Microvirga sp. 3-52]|nr:hypothetical protein [Microvirga sp. 3-52]